MQIIEGIDMEPIGSDMYDLMVELFPICRSITGNGVRKSLEIIGRQIDLRVVEVPSGTQVFDWTIPKEWNINDAYVKNAAGEKIIDFQKSNLHILNYSTPVRKKVGLDELKQHLFTIPEHPEWIPYRTSYYKENWGFCISHNQYRMLSEGEYDVVIDSSLEKGSLSYGEFFIEGRSREEVLISCHICHPSLCNDNLSGIALSTLLAKTLSSAPTFYSYRFLFIPGTIGSITWLAGNTQAVKNIKHGLIVSCVGDEGKFIYKKTRRGDTEIDRVVIHLLKNFQEQHEIIDFFPYGYDERQYCSPGFNLPVGCLSRSTHGRYPEYHTSGDNFDIVTTANLITSFSLYRSVVAVLESNTVYVNKNPYCEPQLGKRGLYDEIGARSGHASDQMAMLWLLNFSDGHHSLLDISEKSGINFYSLHQIAQILCDYDLLEPYRA